MFLSDDFFSRRINDAVVKGSRELLFKRSSKFLRVSYLYYSFLSALSKIMQLQKIIQFIKNQIEMESKILKDFYFNFLRTTI